MNWNRFINMPVGVMTVFVLMKITYFDQPLGVAIIMSIFVCGEVYILYNIWAFFTGRPMYHYGKAAPGQTFERLVVLAFCIVSLIPVTFMIYRAVWVQLGFIPRGGL